VVLITQFGSMYFITILVQHDGYGRKSDRTCD